MKCNTQNEKIEVIPFSLTRPSGSNGVNGGGITSSTSDYAISDNLTKVKSEKLIKFNHSLY